MPLTEARRIVLAEMDERPFQDWITEYARLRGWEFIYHTFNSRRSEAGFPDLFMVRGERAVALEVKGHNGKAMPKQKQWVAAMQAAHIEAYIVWPWDEEMVMDLLR